METVGGSGVQWRPNGAGSWPRIVVLQGDLTACPADAVVNAANSQLWHGGGLAGAIARRGGRAITDESAAWIEENGSLPVGKAMVTSGGELPCRFVIHTVGPMISGDTPTADEAQLLRNAVWSALCEAEQLGIRTIAIPGISSGIFGYPRDLAAREILGESVRFCRERCGDQISKALGTIALMNNDAPTCESFVKAMKAAAGDALEAVEDDPFARDESASTVDRGRPTLNGSDDIKQHGANDRERKDTSASAALPPAPAWSASEETRQQAAPSRPSKRERQRHTRTDGARCTIM